VSPVGGGGRQAAAAVETATDDVSKHVSEMNIQQSVDGEVTRETDRLQHVGEFNGKKQRLVARRHSISAQQHVYHLKLVALSIKLKVKKGKGTKSCIAPHSENLTPEALRYGSHSLYAANTAYMHLPRKRSPDGASTS